MSNRLALPSSANSAALRRLFIVGLINLPTIKVLASPLSSISSLHTQDEEEGLPADDASLWIYLGVAVLLVLLGGVFAGLTIALMGQDEINLQVIRSSSDEREKVHAAKVLNLLKRGKHWVLVTLLLSNVITNETLPVILDRSLGGGWMAVVSSTALIVVFGEIIPQSVCVRYGLSIGAYMSPIVLGLMYIMSPVTWPIAKLLDYLLGVDHGTIYKKDGLKTLVALHGSHGSIPTERLNDDEITIISSVLDLKAKPVKSIMTYIKDVYTMSSDAVLDEKTVDAIFTAGYSRIPVHKPGKPHDFIGMLLVRTLITYDPEDAKKLAEFALATLPETSPNTSCLDIINFFQEGKSHMVLVSETPGQSEGAIGVVTLEDVIEELIGEEVIDESDVFIDNRRLIRRSTDALLNINSGKLPNTNGEAESSSQGDKLHGLRKLRSRGQENPNQKPLGPSNRASHPISTRYASIIIKPQEQSNESTDGNANNKNGSASETDPLLSSRS